jgi:two-component system, NtrC family, sensor kinase
VLSHWPIRTKLKLGLGLLLFTVLALFGSAYYGLYAYRGLVRSLSARAGELPLARDVSECVSNMRLTLSQAEERLELPFMVDEEANYVDAQLLGERFATQVGLLEYTLGRYESRLDESPLDDASQLADDRFERNALAKINRVVAELKEHGGSDWRFNEGHIGELRRKVDMLQADTLELPSHLQQQLEDLAGDVRSQYRSAIAVAWVNVAAAVVMLAGARRVFYKWFADPLHVLVIGSRQVAGGDFDHRIQLNTGDEIGELADAMNAMTTRFREIRNDLDRQVQERTIQVVRSEQLASVGFLAAGVSHEINNPLASIALCSESLESRLGELLDGMGPGHAEEVQVARHYLQMIQREAFRCKQITEKLLDFARRGDSQRHATDLRELAAGVIDMVQHLGRYQDRELELAAGPPVIAAVNPQEIKQVVLNLVTNGLESLEAGGKVRVSVDRAGDAARIIIEDDGCGMNDEVRKHLFEPFFTRRRSGQGTGLGLSITHRIVEEHRGHIDATSDGPGRGSRFVVSLPASLGNKETQHGRQAA